MPEHESMVPTGLVEEAITRTRSYGKQRVNVIRQVLTQRMGGDVPRSLEWKTNVRRNMLVCLMGCVYCRIFLSIRVRDRSCKSYYVRRNNISSGIHVYL